jgi:exopolysaccharide production protein ExoZ
MEDAALDRGGASGRCRRVVGSDVTAEARERAPANFLTIQALRAVAALLVVLLHAFETWGERVDPGAPGVNWENGASGVDIFFVISGFVMVISSRRLVDQVGAWLIFLRHRVVRIVPLYWLLTTAKILAVVVLGGLVLRTGLDFNFVAGSYLFLPVSDSAGHFRPVLPVGWTLTYEFLFYLLFAAALAMRVDVLRVIIPGLGLIAIAALARTEAWPVWTILFNTIVMEFVFGVTLAKWTVRGFRLPPAIAGVFILFGFGLILIVPMISENARVLTWGIPAFVIVAGAVSLEPFVAPALPRWLLTLGDASYSIYLSHGFVLPAFGILVSTIVSRGLWTEGLTIILCLMVSSIAGWIVFILIESPMLHAMRRATTLRQHGRQ